MEGTEGRKLWYSFHQDIQGQFWVTKTTDSEVACMDTKQDDKTHLWASLWKTRTTEESKVQLKVTRNSLSPISACALTF